MKRRSDRILKWFFGAHVIDEYTEKEIGRISTKAIITVFIFELIFIASTFFIANNGMITNFENYFYLTLFVQFMGILLIIAGFTMLSLNRRNLTAHEVTTPKEKEIVVSYIKRKYIRLAPIMFFLFLGINTIWNFPNGNPFKVMIAPERIGGSMIYTILFCTIMYFYEKGEVNIAKEGS